MGMLERRHLPLVFVDSLDAPALTSHDEHHLRRALRMRDGDELLVSDGHGGLRPARLGPTLEPTGPVEVEPSPRWPIAVGFAPVKNQRPEWIVQKLTELGVDRIVPITTERAVVRWDHARADRLAQRFETTAREACMQSRRLRLPTVEPVRPVADVIHAARAGVAPVVLADPAGRRPTEVDRFVLIGPEGGWSATEVEGASTMALPGNILRSETAAVAAAVVLAGFRQRLFDRVV